MADENEWKGASWKQEEDFSKETDAMLEEINADLLPVLLRSTDRDVGSFVEEILVLEKKARLGGDFRSTSRLAVEVMKMYRTQKNYDEMLTKLEFLIKRRGQMKTVQSAMIAECAKALDELPGGKKKKNKNNNNDADADDNATAEDSSSSSVASSEARVKILTQLVHVTAGKIHVELEHARFTVELAHIIEVQQGSLKEAAAMLSELQVETITQMPRTEKVEIILDQLRLLLAMNDLVRVPSTSRKISHRALSKKDSRELKIRYFQLMGDYYRRLKQYFMVAKCEYEIYLTAMGTGGAGAAAGGEEEDGPSNEAGANDLDAKAPTAVKRKNTHLVKTNPSSTSSGAVSSPTTTTSSSNNTADATKKSSSFVDEALRIATTAAAGGSGALSPEMEVVALNSLSNCALLVILTEHLSAKEVEDQSECCAFGPQTLAFTSRAAWLAALEKNKALTMELPSVHSVVVAFNSKDLIREEVAPRIAELVKGHPLLMVGEGEKEGVEGGFVGAAAASASASASAANANEGEEEKDTAAAAHPPLSSSSVPLSSPLPPLSENALRRKELSMRLSEHDILIAAKSFSRIKISRLAELVALPAADCERFIMTMVNDKALTAKIDRIDSLVVFHSKKKASEDVQEWNTAVEKVSELVDKAAHLIVKERMLQRISEAQQQQNSNALAAAIAVAE